MSPLFPLCLGSLYFLLVPVLKLIFPSLFEILLEEAGSRQDPTADDAGKQNWPPFQAPQAAKMRKVNSLEAGSTVPMIESWGFSF